MLNKIKFFSIILIILFFNQVLSQPPLLPYDRTSNFIFNQPQAGSVFNFYSPPDWQSFSDKINKMYEVMIVMDPSIQNIIRKQKEEIQINEKRHNNIQSELKLIIDSTNSILNSINNSKLNNKSIDSVIKEFRYLLNATSLIAEKTEIKKIDTNYYLNIKNLENSHDLVFNNDFNDDLAPVFKNNAWGYVNKKGKLIIPYKYDYAGPFGSGLASVMKNGERFYINTHDSIVILLNSGIKVAQPFTNGFALLEGNNDYYFIRDINGKTIKEFNREKCKHALHKRGYFIYSFFWDNPFYFRYSYIHKRNENHSGTVYWWGLIDYKGNQIIDFINFYDYIKPVAENTCVVKKDGLYGYYDVIQKKLLIDCRYNYAYSFFMGYAIVKNKANKFGVINKNNLEVIPCRFKKIIKLPNGNFSVSRGGAIIKIINDKPICVEGNCKLFNKISTKGLK